MQMLLAYNQSDSSDYTYCQTR